MLHDILEKFPEQFNWQPEIKNIEKLVLKDITVVAGMGGSHLAANILNTYRPDWDVIVYSDYGLNLPPSVLENSLVVASSYSGDTEEVIDVFKTALTKNLPLAVIASGGKLLKLAQENSTPYIQIPDTSAEPRFALGFSFLALLKLLDKSEALAGAHLLSSQLNNSDLENQGQELAQKLYNKIPVIYSSANNFSLAYNWKIKFNETVKIPAFCNVLPEANHNEMNGFDTTEKTAGLMEKFHFIFLQDKNDNPKILKRLSVLKNVLEKQGFQVETLLLAGEPLHKIFSSLLLADWTSYHLSLFYKTEPIKTPLIHKFKDLLAE